MSWCEIYKVAAGGGIGLAIGMWGGLMMAAFRSRRIQ